MTTNPKIRAQFQDNAQEAVQVSVQETPPVSNVITLRPAKPRVRDGRPPIQQQRQDPLAEIRRIQQQQQTCDL